MKYSDRLNLLPAMQRLFPGEGIIRKTAILAGGTALAQGLAALVYPFITRLYTPEAFGLFSLFLSLSSILALISAGRYELAIPLPKTAKESAGITTLAMVIISLFCSVLLVVVLFARSDIAGLFNSPALTNYLWALPLAVLLIGSYETLSYWAISQKKYGLIARTKFHQSFGRALIPLGFGLVHACPFGLIAGEIIGQSAGVTDLAVHSLKYDKDLSHGIRAVDLRRAAGRYRRFPLFTTWSSLLNTSCMRLVPVLLAAHYGLAVAGFFALGQRLFAVPLTICSNSVRQVFLGEASASLLDNPPKLLGMFFSILSGLFLIAAIPVLLLVFTGPWVCEFVFGPEWRETGRYLQVLAPVFLLQFCIAPIANLAMLEKQIVNLVFDIIRFTMTIGALFFSLWMSLSPLTAIALYAGGMAVSYCILLFMWIYIVKNMSNQKAETSHK